MKILALEFSTSRRSVAVFEASAGIASEVSANFLESEKPGTGSFGLIESALACGSVGREEIDCLAIGIGPGSYAGIRGAIAIAIGWQCARPIKIIAVGADECIAFQLRSSVPGETIGVAIDAQRQEFYLSTFELNPEGGRLTQPLSIVSFPEIQRRLNEGERIVGPDLHLRLAKGETFFPSSAALAELASHRTDFVLPQELQPVSLREIAFVKTIQPGSGPAVTG